MKSSNAKLRIHTPFHTLYYIGQGPGSLLATGYLDSNNDGVLIYAHVFSGNDLCNVGTVSSVIVILGCRSVKQMNSLLVQITHEMRIVLKECRSPVCTTAKLLYQFSGCYASS